MSIVPAFVLFPYPLAQGSLPIFYARSFGFVWSMEIWEWCFNHEHRGGGGGVGFDSIRG